MIGFWAKYSINFCPYRSLGKNVRELTHQSIRSHHPCIGKAVPIIFEVESIHSISKEIFFFVQFIRSNSENWESPASMEVPGNQFGRG